MSPFLGNASNIQIVLSDTIEGRVTYNVVFPDSTVLESMYPEEIANGLATNVWNYNEDLILDENK